MTIEGEKQEIKENRWTNKNSSEKIDLYPTT